MLIGHCLVCHQDVTGNHACGGMVTECGPNCRREGAQSVKLNFASKSTEPNKGNQRHD